MDNGSGDAPWNFIAGKCRSSGSKRTKNYFLLKTGKYRCLFREQVRLEISDEHYKDGLHSLSWTFNPGAVLSIKRT